MRDALCEPRPIQAQLPILIGGSGRRRPSGPSARHADAWNTSGDDRRECKARSTILDEHCADVGRDRAEIELTISFPIVIRDTRRRRGGAHAPSARRSTGSRTRAAGRTSPVRRTLVAEAIAPFRDLGFSTVIVRLPAPYDRETIERIGEVGALLDG